VTRVLVTGGAGTVARWFVLGASGGVELHVTERHTAPADEIVVRAERVHRVDLRDRMAVHELFRRVRPDVVVHTAYGQHDRSDTVDAAAVVAAACTATGAELVHLSTDVVFDGGHPPYAEDDAVGPVSDYGRWKVEAEGAVLAAVPDVCITRTSLVVAVDPPDPATDRLSRELRSGEPVQLFHDELRQPIRADDLAAELWALVGLDRERRAGVWHLPGPEVLSRMELGLRIAEALNLPISSVRAASAADHPTPRPRDLTMVPGRRGALGVALRRVP
jgi:dTDP-4-dehydrorhamnose reductase